MIKLPEYLTRKYLVWQTEEGERKTLEEFAIYLGVNRSLLSFWMNGARVPNDENIERLSIRFGDEIYDIMEKERPNPYLQRVNRVWEFLPEAMQQRIAEEAEKYETTNEVQRTEKTHQRRKTRKT